MHCVVVIPLSSPNEAMLFENSNDLQGHLIPVGKPAVGCGLRPKPVVGMGSCNVDRDPKTVGTSAVRSRNRTALVGPLSSTLADLGGVGEGILHAVPDTARNFDTIPARPGHERNLMAPYFATHRGDCIAEGQECFWIPGGRSGLELSRLGEIVRPEGDDGEQTE